MNIKLSVALQSFRLNQDLYVFTKEPTLFGKSCRLHYSNAEGWKVESLSLFKRIYFLVASLFGAMSLPSLNQQVLKEHKATLDPNDLATGNVRRLARLLIVDIQPPPPQAPKDVAVMEGKLPKPAQPLPPPPPSPVRNRRRHWQNRANRPPLQRIIEQPQQPQRPIPAELKGIPNLGMTSCWLNASLQVLIRSPYVREAINEEVLKAQNVDKPDARVRLCRVIKNFFDTYHDPESKPIHLKRCAFEIRDALYQYKPQSFTGGKFKKSEQQCASTAISGILEAAGILNPDNANLILLQNYESLEAGIIQHLVENPPELPPGILPIQMQNIAEIRGHYYLKGAQNPKEWIPPVEIDISDFIQFQGESAKYRLMGVANHSGGSPFSGHWVAGIPTQEGCWRLSDDCIPRPLANLSGYNSILLYERVVENEIVN